MFTIPVWRREEGAAVVGGAVVVIVVVAARKGEGLFGLGKTYGGANPEPPWAIVQGAPRGRPGREGSVRMPTSRLKRRSHSTLSADVWFQGSSLRVMRLALRLGKGRGAETYSS